MTQRQRREHDGFHDDLRRAVAYYRREAPEQIGRLLDLIDEQLLFIDKRPFACSLLFDDYRHAVLVPFRHMIVYVVENETVDVLAFFHGMRDPVWIERKVRSRIFDER